MSPYICKTHIHVPRNMTSNSQHTYTHNTPKNKHITLYHRNNTHNANKFVAGGSFQSVWSRIGLTERNKWVQLRRTSHNLGMVRLVQKLDENGYCNKNTRYESLTTRSIYCWSSLEVSPQTHNMKSTVPKMIARMPITSNAHKIRICKNFKENQRDVCSF